MSALGDYVHLTKANYNKYGTARTGNKNVNLNVIDSQVSAWSAIHEKFTKSIQFKKDSVEETLQSQVKQYRQFLKSVAEDPAMENEKQSILQDILKEYYNYLKDVVQIDLATGKVSGGSKRSLLNEDISKTLGKLAFNQSKVKFNEVIKSDITAQQLRNMMNNWKDQCDNFFKYIVKSKLSAAEAKKVTTQFGQLKRQVTTALNKMPSELSFSNQFLNIDDKSMRAAARALVKMLEILKIPNLNSIRGRYGEVCLQHFYQQGRIVGVQTASDAIGNAVTSGGFNVKFFKPAQQFLETELKNSKTNLKIENVLGEDNVTDAVLSYTYSSQRKADVMLSVKVSSKSENFRNAGVSVKNYTMEELHLVSGSPLLLFLVNNLTIDQINHYLNLFTEISMPNDSPGGNLENARNVACQALKVMILYAAASGANVGKSVDNIADYLLLNQPDAKNEEDQISVVSVKKLLGYILNKNINFSVTTNNEDLRKYIIPNKFVSGDDPDEAAGKRIANVIMSLHQAKIYVAIPRQSIVAAAKI